MNNIIIIIKNGIVINSKTAFSNLISIFKYDKIIILKKKKNIIKLKFLFILKLIIKYVIMF